MQLKYLKYEKQLMRKIKSRQNTNDMFTKFGFQQAYVST